MLFCGLTSLTLISLKNIYYFPSASQLSSTSCWSVIENPPKTVVVVVISKLFTQLMFYFFDLLIAYLLSV